MKIINRMRGRPRSGFTLVEIMIVVAIIGLLAAIGIPNFVRARQTAQTNACINNLRVIDAAKQQWALEQGKASSLTPSATEIKPYLGRSGSVMPHCPLSDSSGSPAYRINVLTVAPTCPNTNDTHTAVLPI
jgi:prepilin-type N-terminal cleavage/methylation domain-containing protein